MTNTIEPLNLKDLTRLPLSEIAKSDGIGQTIIVITPHKGKIIIDFKEETGFFTRSLKDKKFSEIVKQVLDLEYDAKEWLLQEWLNKR